MFSRLANPLKSGLRSTTSKSSDWWLKATSNLSLRIRYRLGPVLLKAFLSRHRRTDLKKLGSDYGGWVVPMSLLSDSSISYCVGVGEDITFDMALIENFGCEVFSFDPTPRATGFVEQNARDVAKFHFFDVGVWKDQKNVRFYAPRDPSHVSHSIVNLQDTAEFFEAECKSLSTLMRELGHSKLDLLKLDVEGAQYDILDSMIEDGIAIKVLCVEFDQPTPYTRLWRMVMKLKRSGYKLVNVDDWNCTFVGDSIPDGAQTPSP